MSYQNVKKTHLTPSPMFCLLFVLILLFESALELESNEDKLVLRPVELIDLVIQEQLSTESPSVRRRFKENAKSASTEKIEMLKEIEDVRGDEERMRARKVWSRWSKWSDCTKSCGGGSIVRRRLCVAGRCSPGELEEQRRPCAESPCLFTPEVLSPEDMREVE